VSKEAIAGTKRLSQESAFAKELLHSLLAQLPFKDEQIKSAFNSLAIVFPEGWHPHWHHTSQSSHACLDLFNLSRDILPEANDTVREALLSLLCELLVQQRAEFAKTPAVEESIASCLLKVGLGAGAWVGIH